jgi:hypothetical protein
VQEYVNGRVPETPCAASTIQKAGPNARGTRFAERFGTSINESPAGYVEFLTPLPTMIGIETWGVSASTSPRTHLGFRIHAYSAGIPIGQTLLKICCQL